MGKTSVMRAYERFPELLVFKKRFRYVARMRGYKDAGVLATALGVDRKSVVNWQSGAALPNTQGLMAISKLLGASIDWLCGNTDFTRNKIPNPEAESSETDT